MQEEKKLSLTEKVKKVLTHRYKIILFDESKFHEVFSFRHRLMNFVLIMLFNSILLIIGTMMLIKYTSLREYILGDNAASLRRKTTELSNKVIELEDKLTQNDTYIKGLTYAMSGDVEIDETKNVEKVDSIAKMQMKDLQASASDSAFRQSFEEKYLAGTELSPKIIKGIFALSTPIRGGTVSKRYNIDQDFRAVEVSIKQNSPVFAISAGTVIYKEWTPMWGNVVIIEHSDNLISVYRNLGTVPKRLGEKVTNGELLGLSGEKAVTFELWINGIPTDPETYINFEF